MGGPWELCWPLLWLTLLLLLQGQGRALGRRGGDHGVKLGSAAQLLWLGVR